MKSEQKIQSEIEAYLQKNGFFVTKLIATTTNGIPDLLAVKNGLALFVEVKTDRGRLSALQKYRIEELNEYAVAVVCRSVADVSKVIVGMEKENEFI